MEGTEGEEGVGGELDVPEQQELRHEVVQIRWGGGGRRVMVMKTAAGRGGEGGNTRTLRGGVPRSSDMQDIYAWYMYVHTIYIYMGYMCIRHAQIDTSQ